MHIQTLSTPLIVILTFTDYIFLNQYFEYMYSMFIFITLSDLINRFICNNKKIFSSRIFIVIIKSIF